MNPRRTSPPADALPSFPAPALHGAGPILGTRQVALVRSTGFGVLRYGLVFLLLAGGAVKFAAFEAEGIRPFVEHSPFLSWMYAVFSVRAASNAIGDVGGFLMKDLILLGASLVIAAEALGAAREPAGGASRGGES